MSVYALTAAGLVDYWRGRWPDLAHLASDEDPSRRACDGGPLYAASPRQGRVRFCEDCRRVVTR